MRVVRGVTSRMCLKDVRNIFPLSVSKKEKMMLLVTKLTKHLLYIRYTPHATDPDTLRSEVRPHRAAGGSTVVQPTLEYLVGTVVFADKMMDTSNKIESSIDTDLLTARGRLAEQGANTHSN